MKKTIFAALAALFALVSITAATPAFAQKQASVSTQGSITILTPIAITKSSDLVFGSVVRPSAGNSTIDISTSGVREVKNGDAAIVASTFSTATYNVTGEGGQTFSIDVPDTVTITSGDNSLVIDLTPSSTTGSLSGSLGATGNATFRVGGSIVLSSTTPGGAYSGSFNAVVAYN